LKVRGCTTHRSLTRAAQIGGAEVVT